MIKVDHEKCIGCGACTAQCPDVFEMADINGKHVAKVKGDNKDCANEAIDICPVDAISAE